MSAQRENELARATAIADSIKHDVYPAVLFALSRELIDSSKFAEAHGFLEEVLTRGRFDFVPWFGSKRPSLDDLSQAHVLNARCYAEESIKGGSVSPDDKRRATEGMTKAVELYKNAESDFAKGHFAVIYVEWAEMNESLGDPDQAHRDRAKQILSSMRRPEDPLLQSIIQPQPGLTKLDEASLPHDPLAYSYIVTFRSDPTEVGMFFLMPPNEKGQYVDGGSLYLYNRNVFLESYQMYSNDRLSKGDLVRIYWQKVVPLASGDKPRVDLVWNLEEFNQQEAKGNHSSVGKPPKEFVARLLKAPVGGQPAK